MSLHDGSVTNTIARVHKIFFNPTFKDYPRIIKEFSDLIVGKNEQLHWDADFYQILNFLITVSVSSLVRKTNERFCCKILHTSTN